MHDMEAAARRLKDGLLKERMSAQDDIMDDLNKTLLDMRNTARLEQDLANVAQLEHQEAQRRRIDKRETQILQSILSSNEALKL